MKNKFLDELLKNVSFELQWRNSPVNKFQYRIYPKILVQVLDKSVSTENKYLLAALEYFSSAQFTTSGQVREFIEGLKSVHDGGQDIFGADDAEDFAQVGIYIEKSNKEFVEVIGAYTTAKELGISNKQYIPYEEFVEFLEYWELFLVQVEQLRLVPVSYIKDDKLETVEKSEQFKEIEERLVVGEKTSE